MEIFGLKPLVVGKLGLFSGTLKDALMHREGLKGKGLPFWTCANIALIISL